MSLSQMFDLFLQWGWLFFPIALLLAEAKRRSRQ